MLLPEIFRQILAMTIPASVVILVVIGMRFLLRKTPRVFAYMLWAAVLFRLLCPVSLSSDFSVFSLLKLPTASVSDVTTNISSLFVDRDIAPEQSETALDNFIVAPTPENQAISQPKQELLPAYIWFAGLVALVLYGTIQYFYLLLRLQSAVRYADGIYLADQVNAPFVLGWLRPRIYLPSSIAESERQYIILHEQLHIRRLDHIIRLVSYLALCIHWFNPFVWVAFTLSGNDMELSCDEAVIRKMGLRIRADYAVSLLKLSCKRRFLRFAPLAFGEANTKKRIHHIAQYKKTGRFVTVICILLSVFTMTACILHRRLGNLADFLPPWILFIKYNGRKSIIVIHARLGPACGFPELQIAATCCAQNIWTQIRVKNRYGLPQIMSRFHVVSIQLQLILRIQPPLLHRFRCRRRLRRHNFFGRCHVNERTIVICHVPKVSISLKNRVKAHSTLQVST